MDKIILKQLSSLEKVFPNIAPAANEKNSISAFKGERVSYQIAYCKETPRDSEHLLTIRCGFKIEVESPIADCVDIRQVGLVPSQLTTFENNCDDDYITMESGLFPDPLYHMECKRIYAKCNCWDSLWIMVKLREDIKAGTYPVKIRFKIDDAQWEDGLPVCFENGKAETSVTFEIKVIDAVLPEYDFKFAQWFHADCIYKYYDVPCFSDEHWVLMENFMGMAADYGANIALTPIFTPPLDTFVGHERPTVQLLDIALDGGKYSFGFEKLDRFIKMCLEKGIKYFEMAHLFTQWGLASTPKIMATVDGEYRRIFGWDVPSDSEEYTYFLSQLLPALTNRLRELGVADRTFFHLSDEPSLDHLERYKQLKEVVSPYLKGFRLTDALSNYEFYETGALEHPIVGTNHIKPFLENKVEDLFCYYCCGQTKDVNNRMMSMPSARNRSIAAPIFKHNIAGFLQWGYNFYYSKGSEQLLDPFRITDSLYAFPSGDAFSVYPDKHGPLESLRLVVFAEALADLRAMRLLESFIGHDETVKLIEDISGKEVCFDSYPRGAETVLAIREAINAKIEEYLK